MLCRCFLLGLRNSVLAFWFCNIAIGLLQGVTFLFFFFYELKQFAKYDFPEAGIVSFQSSSFVHKTDICRTDVEMCLQSLGEEQEGLISAFDSTTVVRGIESFPLKYS